MTAVIYARYSSDNQREESIEGQIRECTAYAEKNGITVIKHYIDRAFSAKTDNRPEFQQMIKDSGKKLFDVVLVWKFDRFARNRFDSANYKMILKKNGVHLISVMEPIAEGSQGILVETLLEGMAEYYSAELSEKVIRGQTENALKGKCTGGTGTIGYKIDEDKFYHLDPLTSPLVLEAFQRYDNGDKMVEIVNFLNDKGVRNMLGGKMTHSSVNTMLKNRRYIGELSFRDIVVPDAIPVIVPKDLFDRVQKRLDKNKRAPACGKADEEYLLTTKLFCGKCGALMFGESGTSATGRTYYYYKCANVKRRRGCNKKTVQKDWLEDLVVRETMKLIQDDAVIDKIVQLVMDVQNQENTTIPLLEKQLREVNKKLDNLMKAIEDGLYTRTTKERLEALEIQKDELTAKIADEKLKKPSFNENFIRFWLMKFRKLDISQKKQRKALIEIFVNAIFLYDDRMLITFNYKDGTQTVRFEDTLTTDSVEEKSSDLSSSAGAGGQCGRGGLWCGGELCAGGNGHLQRRSTGCTAAGERVLRQRRLGRDQKAAAPRQRHSAGVGRCAVQRGLWCHRCAGGHIQQRELHPDGPVCPHGDAAVLHRLLLCRVQHRGGGLSECDQPPGGSLRHLHLPRHGGHRGLFAGAEPPVRHERRMGGVPGVGAADGPADPVPAAAANKDGIRHECPTEMRI